MSQKKKTQRSAGLVCLLLYVVLNRTSHADDGKGLFHDYQGESIVIPRHENPGFEVPEPPMEIYRGATKKFDGGDMFSGEGFSIYKPDPPIGKRRQLAGKFDYKIANNSRAAAKKSNNQWIRQRVFESVTTSTGELTIGSKLPMFGWLYEVTDIDINETDPQGARFKLEKIPREHWPKGMTLDPYAYPILNGGSIVTNAVKVGSISVRFDESRTCNLRYHQEEFQYSEGIFISKEVKVVPKQNDVLKTSGIRFGRECKVVSIVPPDSETNVVGWVEVREIWPELVPFGDEPAESP